MTGLGVAALMWIAVAPAQPEEEAPPPPDGDPDRERVLRLQEALTNIVHGPALGRLRVGMRVVDLGSGRVLFGRRGDALMDPASNQKVLATATALLRLGAEWRFRTELGGPEVEKNGVVSGDVVLRGTGDPSLRTADLDRMAAALAARAVTRITGGVLADPRRLGSHRNASGERPPLRVSRSAVDVRIRPGDHEGAPPVVTVRPDTEAFVIDNRAATRGRGRSRIRVALSMASGRMRIAVSGRIPLRHPGVLVRRRPPNQALYVAVLMRAALIAAGIEVDQPAGMFRPATRRRLEPLRASVRPAGTDAPAALEPIPETTVLAVHESEPLPILIRRINKDSDNEWAERLLETVGAEIYGGPATPAKGIRVLRQAMSELGLVPRAYVPVNASGLGHANRITADAMADLLRKIFFDPRLGPDLVQSLSTGGIDGTTRNRFRGSPAAERVRAKTGTLRGKSCLAGYVGDGSDILVFSIMVKGLRSRALASVRHAQVSAVSAMMRYARGALGPTPGEEVAPGTDYEVGGDILDIETEEPRGQESPAPKAPAQGP